VGLKESSLKTLFHADVEQDPWVWTGLEGGGGERKRLRGTEGNLPLRVEAQEGRSFLRAAKGHVQQWGL